jgi:hypothetical protein
VVEGPGGEAAQAEYQVCDDECVDEEPDEKAVGGEECAGSRFRRGRRCATWVLTNVGRMGYYVLFNESANDVVLHFLVGWISLYRSDRQPLHHRLLLYSAIRSEGHP